MLEYLEPLIHIIGQEIQLLSGSGGHGKNNTIK
jgi:hypothetical protein